MLAVPGTGRDTNIMRDAGDVMPIFTELGVDLVLSGHRHVPYVWNISGVLVVHSGTASSYRLRGDFGPSYNVVELGSEEVRVNLRRPGEGEEPLVGFARDAQGSATNGELYPDFEKYVRYEKLPF